MRDNKIFFILWTMPLAAQINNEKRQTSRLFSHLVVSLYNWRKTLRLHTRLFIILRFPLRNAHRAAAVGNIFLGGNQPITFHYTANKLFCFMHYRAAAADKKSL
jgi:hypothetical protein